MSDSAFIMLIPDSTYMDARPKITSHHLTVACFGKTANISASGIARLRSTVQMLARFSGGPISAKANGVGVFDAGIDGYAVVDLIDGMGTFDIRSKIENLYGGPNLQGFSPGLDGVSIDRLHGFTPHMTREYLSKEDDFYAEITPDMIDNTSFKFIAIGLWHDDQKYEVAL